MRQQKGFTLIELVIAVGILAILTYFTSTTIRNSIRNRRQLRETIATQTELRDALRIMELDINRAFHYQDINDRLIRESKKEAAKATNKNTKPPPKANPPSNQAEQNPQEQPPSPGANPEEEKPRPQVTQFIGTTNELNFTSLGHVRKYQDAPESDQEEVGYYVKSCLGRTKVGGQRPSYKCLWRRTSPYIDDDITQGGSEMILLENVVGFKLRYLDSSGEEWREEWRTDEQGDPETRDVFPAAVEITLKIKRGLGDKAKTAESMTVAAIHFTNNVENEANGEKSK